MPASPQDLHQATPEELRERIQAERRGVPFLLFRDDQARQRIVELSDWLQRLAVGRSEECEVCLSWDPEVSRLHAEVERVGSRWVISDDGLSRNGTQVAGDRVRGRHRLADGDVIRVGDTRIVFRRPGGHPTKTTRLSDEREVAAHVTDAQRRVLVALCRPLKGGSPEAMPATNRCIADELFLSVPAVKNHLRALFQAFGIDSLQQQEKRRRLAALAFLSGIVTEREL